jgi:FkbM family methyltransferase
MSQSSEEIVKVSCSGKELMFFTPDGEDHIQRVLRSDHRLYEESALIDMLSRKLKRGLVIDVGANIGNHTVFFGKLLGRRVIALEPYERAFRVLERNVELNGLCDKVTLLQKAAGRKSTRGEITPPPEHNWGQARVRATGSGPVEVIRLDDVAIRGPIALIKIDVEGMEADVLKGAWRLLKRKRPVLYVEAQTPGHYATLRRLLRPVGYQMVRRFNHTPTYVFVSCRSKQQIIDALLEKTEALASLEELAIVQRELSRSFSERELALRKSLETAIAHAFERQQTGLAKQLQTSADEQAKRLRAELEVPRREFANVAAVIREEAQQILRSNERIVESLEALRTEVRDGIKASSSAAAESSRQSNEIQQAIEDLRSASGGAGPLTVASKQAAKSQAQSADNGQELKLKLPFEKAFLEIRLRSHGVQPEVQGQYKSLSSRGILDSNCLEAAGTYAQISQGANADASTQDIDDKISVIMTTYNSASFVKNAVLSVLQQTHNDLEVIVVDDASSDDTFDILLELSRTDPRVRPFKMFKNRGTYWCKNYGITRSTGRYIAFQDSDDISDVDRLRLQLRELKLARAVMCTCNYVRVDSAGRVLLNRGLEQRKALISTLFDKKEVLDRAGYFDMVRTSADDEFTRRVGIIFGHERICHVDQPLYRAIVRDGSLTTDASTKSDITAANLPLSDQSFLSAPRREYVRQYSAWHERLKKGDEDPRMPFPQLRRRFPAPARLLPEVHHEECYATASMASFPPRRASLEQAVASILPQVDFLNVYLNGYEDTPPFLYNAKIHVIHSREYGDLRDNGKFFFLDSVPWGYHLTIDDDIIYPPDYVQKMILKIEQYGRTAIVGCHGVILPSPLIHFMKDREVLHFKRCLGHDRLVNLLGTGTTAYHVGTIALSLDNFKAPGMADLWLALAAKRQKIPMICVERPEMWLKPLGEADETSLYCSAMNDGDLQTKVAQAEQSWRLDELYSNHPLLQKMLNCMAAEDCTSQRELAASGM